MTVSDKEYECLIPKVKSVLKEFLGQEYPNLKSICEINVAHSAPLTKDTIPYTTGYFELTEEDKVLKFEAQVDLARMKVVEGSFSVIDDN